MVRVMFEFAAMVAKVAGDTWPSTIAPLPVEAPRALPRSLCETGQFRVALDRVAGRSEVGVEIDRADRKPDQRHAVGHMQDVGARGLRAHERRRQSDGGQRQARPW